MRRKRPVVLAFNRFYLPGFRAGGPIRTLVNMADRLSNKFDFYVITLDRDKGDAYPYPGIASDRWNAVGNTSVWYLPSSRISIGEIVRVVESLKPNVIYLNSFFDPLFTQRVLIARRLGRLGSIPIVLAPRGEFAGAALKLKSIKKKAFLVGATLTGLYKDILWQASSDEERNDIKNKIDFAEEIHVAMNLAPLDDEVDFRPISRKEGEPLRLCFLARISAMKNLDFALRVLREVSAPVVFSIYGPKEDSAYWRECESLIEKLPENIKVVYEGEKKPTEVRRVMAAHDLFFLPTRGENYGHVIHEALSAGLPVLISDRTPWRDLEQQGVGWALPLSSTTVFAARIDEFYRHRFEWRNSMGKRAFSYALEKSNDAGVLESNVGLLRMAIARSIPEGAQEQR